jgi:hypothetical protein
MLSIYVCIFLGFSSILSRVSAQDGSEPDASLQPSTPEIDAAAVEPAVATPAGEPAPAPAPPPQERDLELAPSHPVAMPARAPAAASPRFGQRGIVISGHSKLALSGTRFLDHADSVSHSEFDLGFDVFFLSGLSIGFEAAIFRQDVPDLGPTDPGYLTLSTLAGPRVGFAIPLGPALSLFPKLTFAIHHTRTEQVRLGLRSVPTPFSTSSDGPLLGLYLPLLLHLTSDAYIGFGPSLYHDFSRARGDAESSRSTTQFAATLEVGGVLFGPAGDPREVIVDSASRFSQRGSLVLDGELDVGATFSSSGGEGVTANAVILMPGLDWFFSDRVSFGGTIGYFNQSNSQFTGDNRLVQLSSGVVIGPRFGFDAVLGPSFSVYSRIGLTSIVASAKTETRVAPLREQSTSRLYLQLSSQVLGHFKGHLFAGFGPVLAYDLGSRQEFTASFGMSSIFGAWL